MAKVIISVIGQDRPGILASVSRILKVHGCNIENISQTILQGAFGSLFLVSRPDTITNEELTSGLLDGLDDLELDIYVKDHIDKSMSAESNSDSFVITSLGPDKLGLVEAITSVFFQYSVNVTNLNALFKGGNIARDNVMIFEVEVPVDTSLTKLRASLMTAAEKLGLDISIQHRKIFETMNRI